MWYVTIRECKGIEFVLILFHESEIKLLCGQDTALKNSHLVLRPA